MVNKHLTVFLGTLYKRHGLSVDYVDGYVDSKTPCKFMCAKHGEFTNKPYSVVHQGLTATGCPVCTRVKRREKSRSKKLYGVGVNDWDDIIYINENDKIPEYRMWKDLLKRIYSSKYQSKSPTYIGATLDESWLSLKMFVSDVSKLKNFDKGISEGWSLDKDIIVLGNKHYSLDTCCFVPPLINCNFKNHNKQKGCFAGVYLNKKGRYACDIVVDGVTKYLGSYETEDEAFLVRKKEKQKFMLDLAIKWDGILDDRVIARMRTFDYDRNGNLQDKSF